jgi:flagellar biosynthesis protein FliP
MNDFLALLALFLLMTPFVKMYTVLTLFRYGLGISSVGFEIVIVALAVVLSVLIVEPQVNAAGGVQQIANSADARRNISESLQPFVAAHTDPKILEKFSGLSKKEPAAKEPAAPEAPGAAVKAASFLVSQLKDAFIVGFIIMIPFLVTDLLVTNILMVLGITQISALVVSLPIKILLFVLVDGWNILGQRLVNGYFTL